MNSQPKRFQTLRAALEHEGLSQRKFAKLIGKDDAYVSGLVNGRFQPSLTMADRIQRVLNVDLAAMIP